MSFPDNWKIYCLFEKAFIYTYVNPTAPAPTTCPHNAAHTVNSSLIINFINKFDKLDATVDPVATDDLRLGYSPGSKWVNTTNGKTFENIDGTVSAAVWNEAIDKSGNQTLTNKTISDNTNTIGANEIRTTGASVVIDTAAPPSIGQVLKATSPTAASWQAGGTDDHGDLNGLADDDHTQYALLDGRSSGQTIIGGIAANEDLTLESTSNASKGTIISLDPIQCNDIDSRTTSTLLIGKSVATKIEIANSGVTTEIQGILAVNGTADSTYAFTAKNGSGTNGFKVMAGEVLGDIAFHVADQDNSFQIMEMEADQGFVTLGKTYAQTLIDNGVVYGLDIQHPSNATDFNTQSGIYRIGGTDVVDVAQTFTNKTINTANNTLTIAAGDVTSGTFADARISASSVNQHLIYGTEFQQVASDAESTTTLTKLQTKTTLTTSSLPSGTYRLGYTSEISNAANSVLSEIEVMLDKTIVALATMEADNDYLLFGGFAYQSLSGVITATIKYRVQTTGTAKIRRARLELWRVS